ncbi:MAG: GNAT family N-acetyltransferase [Proteobacteria bacterium]|nr:GNAT family N-acetyltransferase [Pseudomonadota bacterium]
MKIDIAYLKDCPQHLPLIAQWIFNEWGHYNPVSSLDRAKSKLNEHLNKDSLPITFVALENNQPVGTCSLRINDGIRPNIIESAKKISESQGASMVVLDTLNPNLNHFYERCGAKVVYEGQLLKASHNSIKNVTLKDNLICLKKSLLRCILLKTWNVPETFMKRRLA